MEKRKFSKIGDEISLLGYGCMRFPLQYKDKQDINEDEAQQLIDTAMAAGVNYYDTAYPYHDGLSEPFVGRALKKYPREQFYLATKLPMWDLKQQDDVLRIFNEQLERCQTEYFDFYLMHALDRDRFETEKKFGVYQILKQLKEEGKIRHLGFSFHDTPDVLDEILDTYEWDFVQLQINYLDWELQDARRQYELAVERGIPVVVMEPVRGGALASLNQKAQSVLKDYDAGKTIASWAIRYVASLPGVMTVLSGMSDMAQVQDNTGTMTGFKPLSDQEREVLEKALQIYRSSGTIPCTGCRYCMDCPFGVDIPILFSAYNHYKADGNKYQFRAAYKALGEKKHPVNCTVCQKCMKHCPQNINIPDSLKEVQALIQEIDQQEF